jgi:hypothetical protein
MSENAQASFAVKSTRPMSQREAREAVLNRGGMIKERGATVFVTLDRIDDDVVAAVAAMPNVAAITALRRMPALALAQFITKPNLETVQFRSMELSDDDVRIISSSQSLTSVILSGNPISDEGVVPLCKMSQLDHLDLGGTNISNDSIARLAQLSHVSALGLYHTNIDDGCVDSLAKMPRLRWIGIYGTGVSADGLRRLSVALPKCHISYDTP